MSKQQHPGSKLPFKLAWLGLILFGGCFAYIIIKHSGFNLESLEGALVMLLPNIIFSFLAYIVIYYLITSENIPNLSTIDYDELTNHITKLTNKSSHVVDFYKNFRQVDWRPLLDKCDNNLDIVVYYWTSWTKQNYEQLKTFFNKPNSKLRLFVADPDSANLMKDLERLFPDSSSTTLKEKIKNTCKTLIAALDDSNGNHSRLEIYFVPHLLNYSIQRIDNRLLVLSVFDMYRQNRIGAPAIVLDLSISEDVAKYWEKEILGLIRNSKKAPLEELK